jgi:hypothetical protein
MESEDKVANAVDHAEQAPDTSTDAKQNKKRRSWIRRSIRRVLGSARKFASGSRKTAAEAAGVSEAYSAGEAIVDDRKNTEEEHPEKSSAKARASVTAGLAGSYAGTLGGEVIGASIDGAVGALFGGVGAVASCS